MLTIEELKARVSKSKVGASGGSFLKVEKNKPQTVYVLDGCYQPDELFYKFIATHFLNKKRILCGAHEEGKTCYICEQITVQREELAKIQNDYEEIKRNSDDDEVEKIREQIKSTEVTLDKLEAQRKYAFNVLVKGEETARIYEAPWLAFKPIHDTFRSAIEEWGVNILDPSASTAFTVTRTGDDFQSTKYSVAPAPRPTAILEDKAKIEELLKKLPDLDDKYKLPELADQVAAWNTYNGTTPPPIKGDNGSANKPSSMSRIGGKAVTQTVIPKEEALTPPTLGEEHAEQETSRKPESVTKVASLLARLKETNKK